LDQAVALYTQSIEIAREIGNKRSESSILGNLGNIYNNKGDLDRAGSLFSQSIDAAREIGDKASEGIHVGNLGLVYQNKGELDRAIALYTQAIDIAREIGDKTSESTHLGNLGNALFQHNRTVDAEDAFRKAIPIGDEALPVAAGAFRASLALLLAQKGQLNEAQELLKIGELQVTAHRNEHAKLLCTKGQVQLLAGETEAARMCLNQAKALATAHKLGEDVEVTQEISALEGLLTQSS
jgi:tetratricopeptide (TPR) repeat protein